MKNGFIYLFKALIKNKQKKTHLASHLTVTK